ncbi:MAG: hypothetical protein COZ18_08370 [Flexibacter sp. CG_4_10_14_3_um_filter_32_15]|nr:MAG: hypothetical protein COZ18_08370 [Flexibacter sp. CG_4_10_14_3_um_filter_32_15]
MKETSFYDLSDFRTLIEDCFRYRNLLATDRQIKISANIFQTRYENRLYEQIYSGNSVDVQYMIIQMEHRQYHVEQWKFLFKNMLLSALKNKKEGEKSYKILLEFEKYSLNKASFLRKECKPFKLSEMKIYNFQKQLF